MLAANAQSDAVVMEPCSAASQLEMESTSTNCGGGGGGDEGDGGDAGGSGGEGGDGGVEGGDGGGEGGKYEAQIRKPSSKTLASLDHAMVSSTAMKTSLGPTVPLYSMPFIVILSKFISVSKKSAVTCMSVNALTTHASELE